MFGKKGQGTTEYLIILAVVIVIALVVAGVMGWFPGLSSGITAQQSQAYWQGASPIAITQWSVSGTTVQLAVQNMTTNRITLKDVNFDTTDMHSGTDENVAAGGTTSFTGTLGTACTSGQPYQFDVKIGYNVIGGIQNATQAGVKPIVGNCP